MATYLPYPMTLDLKGIKILQ